MEHVLALKLTLACPPQVSWLGAIWGRASGVWGGGCQQSHLPAPAAGALPPAQSQEGCREVPASQGSCGCGGIALTVCVCKLANCHHDTCCPCRWSRYWEWKCLLYRNSTTGMHLHTANGCIDICCVWSVVLRWCGIQFGELLEIVYPWWHCTYNKDLR